MNLKTINKLISTETKQLNAFLQESLQSEVDLINKIGRHIINNSGKRIRPKLTILQGKCFNCDATKLIQLAAVIELIHTASLLHDDVIDDSNIRRGRITSHKLWGNSSAILSGDFLHSRCFQIMVAIGNIEIMQTVSEAANVIAEGEIMQLVNKQNYAYDLQVYEQIIYKKTAKLFEASTKISAQLANLSTDAITTAANFGKNFGMAYQIIDDLLDYKGNESRTGKKVGVDLAEGKMTIPLLFAYLESNNKHKKIIDNALINTDADFNQILEIIEASGSIAKTKNLAQSYLDKAIANLNSLPDNDYKSAMIELTDSCSKRTR